LPSSTSSQNPPGGTNSGPPAQNPSLSSPTVPGLGGGPDHLETPRAPGDNPNLFNPTAMPEGVPSPRLPITDITAPSATTGLPGANQGLPVDASGLSPRERKDDYDVINTQAENFRRRFLQGEAIELRLPMGDQLMPLGSKLPPIRLE